MDRWCYYYRIVFILLNFRCWYVLWFRFRGSLILLVGLCMFYFEVFFFFLNENFEVFNSRETQIVVLESNFRNFYCLQQQLQIENLWSGIETRLFRSRTRLLISSGIIIYATLVVEFLKLLLVALLFPKIAYTVEKNMESKLSTTLQAIGYLKQRVQNHSASFTAVEERFKSSKW